ncbi:hypothetical protein FO519_000354 [Halicephalobus sp. NKZ332]|nr:hypothetical protein FO519_000354 [Halicephalobus sp. NKZ332]
MGANMGKQPTYNYSFPPRRRSSNIENANHFSKDYWGSNGPQDTSNGRIVGSEFWMINSEERYRREVFHRKSENFYPSPSTYKTNNNFESPFASKKPKPLSGLSYGRSLSMISARQPPPYSSGSILGNSNLSSGPPKYLPRCVARI